MNELEDNMSRKEVAENALRSLIDVCEQVWHLSGRSAYQFERCENYKVARKLRGNQERCKRLLCELQRALRETNPRTSREP
jgi:hypothetical protein